MEWYIYLAWIAILIQILLAVLIARNFLYCFKGPRDSGYHYKPKVLLTIPCKGVDQNFQKNITSLILQDYDDFNIAFVVQSTDDPAYEKLLDIVDANKNNSKAKDIKILIAGKAESCSQKIHNLLHSYKNMPPDTEVLAFADSDAYVLNNWLNKLIRPLKKKGYGAASGYRIFVPKTRNLATLALSAMNAKVMQFLGSHNFNQAWGGAMAIKLETFKNIGLENLWPKTVSDDYALSYAVKKAHLKVVFVPDCLVATYEKTTWPKLFEFARRQLLITRVTSPGTWGFALISTIYSLLGLWAGLAIAIYANKNHLTNSTLFTAVPAIFFAGQIYRSILRQIIANRVLEKYSEPSNNSFIADVIGSLAWTWLFLICLVSSAIGRKITWRGITYELIAPTETVIIKNPEDQT